ncbi:hypothetical protein [Picosynechococcus sp. PCC 7117]|uniref:hypothetical protein n=1 Tax=Picosynechococcus sp. PCC 7117 TaxID=195498 RepID=UPI0008108012|nr:hypothetical protein [Picosynechococcus sp. PCC 7117]ANV87943.1 hypothetical protein AWQ22_10995 [Picosynechococcus sp. PCC 7117]
MTWQTVTGLLTRGHQVASGQAKNSPYEAGTIALQTPHFRNLGLDLSGYFPGTLNISIAPKTFTLIQPRYTFTNLQWHPDFSPETFSFSPCYIEHRQQRYDGLIYYPHPETKLGHFQAPATLEVLAPLIPDLTYGDRLQLSLHQAEVRIE